MIAPQRLPSPASVRVGRLSSLLFHFRAADLDVTQALSGQLLTFARAGGDAYSMDSAGRSYVNPYGHARFGMHDYDGDGVRETPGLVLEPSKTNILLQSDNLPNASWTKSLSTAVLVSGIAPDGGSMSLLKEDATASAVHRAFQAVTITAGDYCTLSVYLKAKERFRGMIYFENGADRCGYSFRLDTLALGNLDSGAGASVDFGIKDEGGGVYRMWVTGKVNGASTAITAGLRLFDNSGAVTYTGDGASGMYFWRADFKDGNGTGSELWSGIGTTTATVTRAAESLIATLAWPFQDSLTLYAKVVRPDWYQHSGSLQTSHFPLSLSDTAPYLRMFYNASSRVAGAQVNDGSGNTSVTLSQPTTTPNELCMQATGLKSGGTIRLDVGGGFGSPSAAVAPFTALGDAIIRVGASGAGSGLMGSAIHTLKVAAGLRSLTEMQRIF